MGSMFFGQYLLSKGVISRDALIDAIELQRKTNLSLVELAVREDLLESRRAESILTRYRTTEASLDELCLDVGGLSREQLDKLREIQQSDWVRIGAALVAGDHLSRDEVETHLQTFHQDQREADQQLQADFLACRDPETVKTVVELSIFHLKRFTDRPVKLQSLDEDNGELAEGLRRYGQKLVGDRELYVVLDLPPEIASKVALGFIGIPVEGDSEVAIDAVCECVNIIGGHACTRLEASGFRLRPEPPFSTDGHEPTGSGPKSVCAAVMAGDIRAHVRVFV
jgi:hypothetical protein